MNTLKKFLNVLIVIFFYILRKFSILSAIAAVSYYGTTTGMILNGLLWPYKITYWLVKHFTMNTVFREAFDGVGSAIMSGLMGLPTNITTKPTTTLVVAGLFLLIHFFPQPIRWIEKKIKFKTITNNLKK